MKLFFLKNQILLGVISLLFILGFSQFTTFEKVQDSFFVPGQLLVQLQPDADESLFFEKIKKDFELKNILKTEVVSKKWNLYLLHSDPQKENENVLLEKIKTYPTVLRAGQNFQLQVRDKTPNDPLYNTQWDMDVIDAPAVWEKTTGGLTALGDTIVVAIIEGGDWSHDDLVDNLWINQHEINNDGIDNDGNGYVDDYFGWNTVDSSDLIVERAHSTWVAGILGARGDNSMGVSGVNWNVKIMYVHSDLKFNEIVESYEYVYKTRKLYNDTNGEKGALVVATNSSFGVGGDNVINYPDGLQITDNPFFPMWCDMYDMLGSVGVLNAGATDNDKYNVDEFGDMPSICPSDYLIAVTNITQGESLKGAYGVPHIDLAGPGDNSPTTGSNNTYTDIDGTSSATPHVAGGIALLYSLPCEKLATLAIEDPPAAALLMKDIILNGVEEMEVLEDMTVSGGRLNLANSMLLVNDFCGSSTGLLDIHTLFPNPTREKITVGFTPNKFGPYDIKIYNFLGQLMGEDVFMAEEFLPAQFEIDVSQFKHGAYFINISNSDDFTSASFVVL